MTIQRKWPFTTPMNHESNRPSGWGQIAYHRVSVCAVKEKVSVVRDGSNTYG